MCVVKTYRFASNKHMDKGWTMIPQPIFLSPIQILPHHYAIMCAVQSIRCHFRLVDIVTNFNWIYMNILPSKKFGATPMAISKFYLYFLVSWLYLSMISRGALFFIFAYTCVLDLFIGGLFTLQMFLWGMLFFKIKVNVCIIIHHVYNYYFLGESFKNTSIYLYYIVFLYSKYTQNHPSNKEFFFSIH